MKTLDFQSPALSSSHLLSDFCQGKHTGSYPNMMDCTKYWVCAGGKTYPARCPAPLVFNFKVHGCDTRDSIPSQVADYFWTSCGQRHKDDNLLQEKNSIPDFSALRMRGRKQLQQNLLENRSLHFERRVQRKKGIGDRPVPLGNSPLWWSFCFRDFFGVWVSVRCSTFSVFIKCDFIRQ